MRTSKSRPLHVFKDTNIQRAFNDVYALINELKEGMYTLKKGAPTPNEGRNGDIRIYKDSRTGYHVLSAKIDGSWASIGLSKDEPNEPFKGFGTLKADFTTVNKTNSKGFFSFNSSSGKLEEMQTLDIEKVDLSGGDSLTLKSSTSLKPRIIMENSSTNALPCFILMRKTAASGSASGLQIIGSLTAYINNSADEDTNVVNIQMETDDRTDGAEDSQVRIQTKQSGSLRDVLIQKGNISAYGHIYNGYHGHKTRIKLLPSDFTADDGGRPLMIDDTGSDRFLESFGSGYKMYASVLIPTGYKATHVNIYGSGTSALTVYEADINSKTVTSKGTGNIGTEIDITDVNSDDTNYILIEAAQGAGEEVYGGYVTIATI